MNLFPVEIDTSPFLFTLNTIMLILILLLVSSYGAKSYPAGQCKKKDSSGRMKWFCCNNHEEVNGNCIKCVNGFESFDGSPCMPCPNGFWGEECADRCSCIKDEICDHILGCTNIQIDIQKETTGLSTTALVAFSICAVMVVFFVILCIVCQRRYKKIYDIFKMYQTGDGIRNTTDHPFPQIPLGEVEGIYEEIDESNMIDNVGNLRDVDISVADTNESYVQFDNNGYLTPFQPDDEYTSTDNSNDNTSESIASTHDSHSFPIDHLSTSSSSDVQGRRSSYLNPYQPIVLSADIYEYSSTNIIYKSSSSGSETLFKGSGYLNPYQPMVPDLDLHDYKSVSGCAGGSSSPMLDACTKDIVPGFPHLCQDQKSEIDTQNFKSSNDISSETVLARNTSQVVSTSVLT